MLEGDTRAPARIRAVGRALPAHYVDQESLTSALSAAWGEAHFNPERLEALHRAVQVSGRHLALIGLAGSRIGAERCDDVPGRRSGLCPIDAG